MLRKSAQAGLHVPPALPMNVLLCNRMIAPQSPPKALLARHWLTMPSVGSPTSVTKKPMLSQPTSARPEGPFVKVGQKGLGMITLLVASALAHKFTCGPNAGQPLQERLRRAAKERLRRWVKPKSKRRDREAPDWVKEEWRTGDKANMADLLTHVNFSQDLVVKTLYTCG